MTDALHDILCAASKHPNSRVSKLIHTVQEETSQKNIVLLLIELAEHAEYSVDFNISLKYYLDLFERLGINHDLVLNEAGLLLVSSSKIYSKRIDYVQSLVERHILTLSNADAEIEQQKLDQQQESQKEGTTPAEKPKKGRKRALEVPSDPYEVELVPKKFKKLTKEKRFAMPKQPIKPKLVQRNIEMEQHIHPAGWLHAAIYDFENEEDVDTKRNYKLFTYHIEHRYNTLVPDINFLLHFKVKDYMDEQEEMDNDEEASNTDRSWPPLSEAYVQKYLHIENYVLQQDVRTSKRKRNGLEGPDNNAKEQRTDGKEIQLNNAEDNANNTIKTNELNATLGKNSNDTGLGESLLDESNKSLNASKLESIAKPLEITSNTESLTETSSLNLTTNNQQPENDSALGSSLLDRNNTNEMNSTVLLTNESLNTTTEASIALNDTSQTETQQVNSSREDASFLENSNNTDINTTDINTTAELSNTSNLETTTLTEGTGVNDTGFSASLLDQTKDTEISTTAAENISQITVATTDASNISNTEVNGLTESIETVESQAKDNEIIKTAEESKVEKQTNNTEINTTPAENSTQVTLPTADASNISNTEVTGLTESTEAIESQTMEKETMKTEEESKIEKQGENRKDLALGEGKKDSRLTENMAPQTENLKELDLQIDSNQSSGKDPTQITINLPHNDDEGVYLSDLEEQDYRLLSPVIKAVNILPGVVSKDVTIYMDEELREALDMRDGIMDHFGTETYKIPVFKQAVKHDIIFNIFKLPEKILRRKILFKLGPDMDLFLQARCLKRTKPEPLNRSLRKFTPLQWFALNDTDMTGVYMTPPYSPGHCSDFCGFTDNENGDGDDDAISCSDFCGFTEEEQIAFQLQNIHRLSRDSGVGVDVNNLTPDRESMEIIFERGELSQVKSKETIETLLNRLPVEIREALTTELNESEANAKQATSGSTQKLDLQSNEIENIEKTVNSSTNNENSQNEQVISGSREDNNEGTDKLTVEKNSQDVSSCTEDITQQSNETKNTRATENTTLSDENSKNNTETLNVQNTENTQDRVNTNLISTQEIENLPTCNETEQSLANSEQQKLLKSQITRENETTSCDKVINNENDESLDDIRLDLNTQGTKSKIQQWHEHLQPILAKSRERHHFDVFQLGTEIIDTVHSTNKSNNETSADSAPIATFQDIMENRDPSYVSRYFLSTLLLANQNNIEICIENKSSDKPSSWQDINLRLLSTKRHTVDIEDNIGLIDNNAKHIKQTVYKKQSKSLNNTTVLPEEEDKPLSRIQNTLNSSKRSFALKRSNDNATSTPIVVKKPKESSAESEFLIQSTAIKPAPLAFPVNSSPLPSTSSHQAKLNDNYHVNLNAIRTLQPIEKVQNRNDDLDSGIYSMDEISTL